MTVNFSNLKMKGITVHGQEFDPYFANVQLLIQGFGTNGSTTITDSSSFNRTITIGLGSPHISNGQYKWPSANNTSFLGSLTDEYVSMYVTIPPSAPGAQSWTCEMWMYRNANGDNISTIGPNVNLNVGLKCPNNSGTYQFGVLTSSIVVTTVSSVPLNEWVFLAVSYDVNVNKTYFFFNGVLENTYSGALIDPFNGNPCPIGIADPAGFCGMPFYLQDLRLTTNVCRYNATFPVPTGPFPTA